MNFIEKYGAVKPLIILNIFAFITQMFLGPSFTNSFLLNSADLLVRPWIILTSMFLHGGFSHLLFNMYVLFMFGSLLEQRIGPKRFYLIYFTAGILAALGASLLYPRALGASGAIMGIMGALIIFLPNMQLLFFFVIPMKFWIAAILIALIDTFGIFYPSGTGNLAHLVGMAVGLGYGYYIKKKSFIRIVK